MRHRVIHARFHSCAHYVRSLGYQCSCSEMLVSAHAGFANITIDPPPLKWSDLRYVFDIKEDCNGKEAMQACVFRFNVGGSGVPIQGNIGAFATVCADSS